MKYQIYLKWFDHFLESTPITGIIYLQCDPTIAYDRVIKRNRSGETIPLEYLERCHNYHEKWIQNSDLNILTINCNKQNSDENNKLWTNQIADFIKNPLN